MDFRACTGRAQGIGMPSQICHLYCKMASWVSVQAHLCQELAGNCLQSLLGPSSEPVDGCIVDQSRKVPATCLESLSNGRHTQDNVQVSSTLFDEVGPHALSGGLHTCLHGLITNLIHTMYMYKLNPGRLVHMYMLHVTWV